MIYTSISVLFIWIQKQIIAGPTSESEHLFEVGAVSVKQLPVQGQIGAVRASKIRGQPLDDVHIAGINFCVEPYQHNFKFNGRPSDRSCDSSSLARIFHCTQSQTFKEEQDKARTILV